MKLRDDDKKWVQQEVVDQIQAAITPVVDSLSPHGWRKAAFVLRELGPLTGTISVILALLAITLGALYQSWGHVKEEATFRQRTDDRLTLIERDIKAIQNSVTLTSFKQEVSGPPNQETARALTTILQTARRGKIPLPPDGIGAAGQKFIAASNRFPEAWEASLAFLDYRSYLNPGPLPLAGLRRQSLADNDNYEIQLNISNDYGRPKDPLGISDVWLADSASPDESARIEFMPQPPKGSSGVKFIILDWHRPDVALILDMEYMKNVVVRNAVVRYSGGPVRLENVYFVNCTFEVPARPSGQSFAKAVLSSAAITFSSS